MSLRWRADAWSGTHGCEPVPITLSATEVAAPPSSQAAPLTTLTEPTPPEMSMSTRFAAVA